MMDTDAIYSAVCAYGKARWRGVMFEPDAAEHLSEIKRLLNEADAERQELLAENERLVDEVAEARKETGEQARLNGMGAEREARLMAENAELKSKLTEKASLLRGCYARINWLQKDEARLDYLEKNARCDPKMDGNHVWWPTSFNQAQNLKGQTLRIAIDAALEKKHEGT